jgi:hypothetical protein
MSTCSYCRKETTTVYGTAGFSYVVKPYVTGESNDPPTQVQPACANCYREKAKLPAGTILR